MLMLGKCRVSSKFASTSLTQFSYIQESKQNDAIAVQNVCKKYTILFHWKPWKVYYFVKMFLTNLRFL